MILTMNDINVNYNNASSDSSPTSSPSTSSSSLVTLTLENVNRLSERQEKKSMQKNELFSSIMSNIGIIKSIEHANNNINNDNGCKIKSKRFKSPKFNIPSIQQETSSSSSSSYTSSIIVQIQSEQPAKFQHNNLCLYRSRRFKQPPSLFIKI
jgi:hypothetical protein